MLIFAIILFMPVLGLEALDSTDEKKSRESSHSKTSIQQRHPSLMQYAIVLAPHHYFLRPSFSPFNSKRFEPLDLWKPKPRINSPMQQGRERRQSDEEQNEADAMLVDPQGFGTRFGKRRAFIRDSVSLRFGR